MDRAASGHALVIEDDALIAFDLEDMLLASGFTSVDLAPTVGDAIKLARTRRPNLVTADFRLADGTGVQAVAAIRAAIGEVPVIYITGNVDSVELGKGETALEKPIDGGRLADACRRVATASS